MEQLAIVCVEIIGSQFWSAVTGHRFGMQIKSGDLSPHAKARLPYNHSQTAISPALCF
jgi:hypothetical protein